MNKVNFKHMYLISEERFKAMNSSSPHYEGLSQKVPFSADKNDDKEIPMSLEDGKNVYNSVKSGFSIINKTKRKPSLSIKNRPMIPFRKVYTRKYNINLNKNKQEVKSDQKRKTFLTSIPQNSDVDNQLNPSKKKRKFQDSSFQSSRSNTLDYSKKKTRWNKLR